MTLQTTKPTQMRLHSCVLSQPKRDKVHEKLKNRAYVTVKIDNRPDNAAVRVANVRENGQPRRNTQLLGKYPLKKADVSAGFLDLTFQAITQAHGRLSAI
ncbi:conserved hypothetical protein [Roseibium sp. TrichSKD4]|uniref:hypothetical protein n=2 Tax=Roseibium sp. TrichSKD4 TaxID=744980 RepID=UPI0001E567FB|nr:conserved hypothetical protein [Roseibium sp. TrichSKD4]